MKSLRRLWNGFLRPWHRFTEWFGAEHKTRWDWTGLLGIPLFLAGLAIIFANCQGSRDERIERDRNMDGIVQAYVAQLTAIAVQLPTIDSGDPYGAVDPRLGAVDSLTRNAVEQLDGKHKASILRYLTTFVTSRLFPNSIIDSFGSFAPQFDFTGADFSDSSGLGLEPLSMNISALILKNSSFRNSRLSYISMHHVDLQGADFRDSYVYKSVFGEETQLVGATFRNSVMYVADFLDLNLQDVDFSGSNMTTVFFNKSDLSGANFSGATLNGVSFSDANLTGAKFKGAKWIGTSCPDGSQPTGQNCEGHLKQNSRDSD